MGNVGTVPTMPSTVAVVVIVVVVVANITIFHLCMVVDERRCGGSRIDHTVGWGVFEVQGDLTVVLDPSSGGPRIGHGQTHPPFACREGVVKGWYAWGFIRGVFERR